MLSLIQCQFSQKPSHTTDIDRVLSLLIQNDVIALTGSLLHLASRRLKVRIGAAAGLPFHPQNMSRRHAQCAAPKDAAQRRGR